MSDGNLFGGRFTRRPGVRAVVDDHGLNPFQVGSPRTVAIVGVAQGGVPKVPTSFSAPSEARRTLRGGEPLDSILRAFDPSAESFGASIVMFVRANPATQAALTLKDDAGANAIDLASSNYGALDNQINVKVEAGSVSGKRLSVASGSDLIVRDNLFRAAFSISYVGAGTGAVMTISGTQLTTAVTGGPGGENLALDFASFPDVQSLVAKIDASVAYNATVLTPNPSDKTAAALDFVTAQDIKTAVYTETATLDEIVRWLNTPAQPYVTAKRSAGAGKPPANVVATYLSGGSDGVAVNQDWQAAIAALESRDIAFLVPVTADAAIHAMAQEHVERMSRDGRRPRRAVVGAALGEKTNDLSSYLSRAAAINSDRVQLVAEGGLGLNASGVLAMLPPYVLAAGIAGMWAGVSEVGESLTFKSVKLGGLEWIPTLSDLEALIGGGVMPIELVENRGFFRVARAVSTWRKDDNFARTEFSAGMALDQVVRDVIEGLERFIGQKASPIVLHRVASAAETILLGEQRAGVIVGDAANPAFSDIQVQLAGDVVSVSFNVNVVVPINFINVTLHANTFTGQVTFAIRAAA